ncbi:DoxX family membrane protein [Allokutzneria multivorans]|uniref:DoxX family membrane protein n=1 Tax=Allokutzneria multivorans TaxID=1142134 RepID=A0ABP7TM53_9PSEU
MSTNGESAFGPSSTSSGKSGEIRPFTWTAGADFGQLVLRFALGGTFIAHGAQKIFGAFGGPGITGFAQFLQSKGFTQTTLLAWLTGLTELVGGALVVIGLFTPLAAAGLLAVMINVVILKWGGGFFLGQQAAGFEFDLVLGAMAAGVVLTGPGRLGLDTGFFWSRRPLGVGVGCLAIAVAATLLMQLVFRT